MAEAGKLRTIGFTNSAEITGHWLDLYRKLNSDFYIGFESVFDCEAMLSTTKNKGNI